MSGKRLFSRKELLIVLVICGAVGLLGGWLVQRGVDTNPPDPTKIKAESQPRDSERNRFAVLTDLEGATTGVVKQVGPAVVKIVTKEKAVIDHFFVGQIVQEREGIGSGVIVDDKGHIITNNHVVAGASEIKVLLPDRQDPYRGRLIGADPFTDLAVLKIDGKDLPVANMGDSSKLKVGQFVIAIGNPYGFENSVTLGLVSALGRGLLIDPEFNLQVNGVIQTDASINPGNSGGPLLDLEGKVIGINTAIIERAQGIGFAIPINTARETMAELIAHGKILRLGILGGAIDEVFTSRYKRETGMDLPTETGIYIVEVVKGSPADEAGIQPGDIISGIGGKDIRTMDELTDEVKKAGHGGTIGITFFRGDRGLAVTVTL
ncbi:MAG: PDZ domain-containing protein [Firmicutes bacterium]|nr:PDZ domain-containing protein [Bacillota bacterium]